MEVFAVEKAGKRTRADRAVRRHVYYIYRATVNLRVIELVRVDGLEKVGGDRFV